MIIPRSYKSKKLVALFSEKQIFVLASFLFPPAAVLLVSIDAWRLQRKQQAILGFVAFSCVSFVLAKTVGVGSSNSSLEHIKCYFIFFIINYAVVAAVHYAFVKKFFSCDEGSNYSLEKNRTAMAFVLLAGLLFAIQFVAYVKVTRLYVSSLYLKADILAQREGCNASISAFRKSYDKASLFDESEIAAFSLARIGACQLKDGNADEALSTLSQALSIANQKKSIPAKMLIYGSIGDYYLLRNEYDTALSHKLMSLDLRRDSVFQSGFAPALVEIAVIYMKLLSYKDAIGYYEQALHRYKELGDKYQQANVSVQLGDAYRKIGNEGLSKKFFYGSKNTFLDLGKTKQAEYVQGVIDRRIVLSH